MVPEFAPGAKVYSLASPNSVPDIYSDNICMAPGMIPGTWYMVLIVVSVIYQVGLTSHASGDQGSLRDHNTVATAAPLGINSTRTVG